MRFLLINKEYPPTPDASGAIVYRLCAELKKKGHHVDVIARSDKAHVDRGESGDIFWIEISGWEKLSQKIRSGNYRKMDMLLYRVMTYVRKFWLMFQIHKFPDSEPAVTKRTVEAYETYLKDQKIDCVIGFFRPYSCLSAAMQIAADASAKSIACYFDLVDAKTRPSLMPPKLYEKLILRGDRKVMDRCDHIMLPVSAGKKADLELNEFKNVIYYEFPTFRMNAQQQSVIGTEPGCPEDRQTIKLVFAGTMDSDYRNPESMLQVLKRAAQVLPDRKICLDVFGGGDCSELFRTFEADDHFSVTYHGRVPKEKVAEYEARADFLVNIMNAYEAIVPSKIFELFSSCKPIINFVTLSDDGSLEYLKKYPLCHTVDWSHVPEEKRDYVIGALAEFMICSRKRRADRRKIETLFHRCTPQYVAEQIICACQEGENG